MPKNESQACIITPKNPKSKKMSRKMPALCEEGSAKCRWTGKRITTTYNVEKVSLPCTWDTSTKPPTAELSDAAFCALCGLVNPGGGYSSQGISQGSIVCSGKSCPKESKITSVRYVWSEANVIGNNSDCTCSTPPGPMGDEKPKPSCESLSTDNNPLQDIDINSGGSTFPWSPSLCPQLWRPPEGGLTNECQSQAFSAKAACDALPSVEQRACYAAAKAAYETCVEDAKAMVESCKED